MPKKLKRLAVLCGGSGGSELLAALHGQAHITAILPATDSGGSGGWCREQFNMIAPGDFRRVLVALSNSKDENLKKEFLRRYEDGPLKGQTVGNLILASFYQATGDFDKAVEQASTMLEVTDKVYPVTKKLTTLCAELEDGTIIRGETNIDVPKHDKTKKIVRLFVDPKATIHPEAAKAIKEADAVIISMGDIYSSVIANIVISGVPEALQKTKAKVYMLVNSVTKEGESDGFSASDFIKTFEHYAGKVVDYAITLEKSNPALLKAYASINPQFARPDVENFPKHIKPVLADWYPKDGAKTDRVKISKILKKLGAL